jgi:drug/metabolite transporter (DMT)-like permease
MRASVWVGIALIIAGVAFYFRGGFTKKETVVDIGPLEVSAEEKQTVPPWVAGLMVGAGVILVAAGARGRART